MNKKINQIKSCNDCFLLKIGSHNNAWILILNVHEQGFVDS